MVCKETLNNLFDKLNDRDKIMAYEFIIFLVHRNEVKLEEEKQVVELFGKTYYIVPD